MVDDVHVPGRVDPLAAPQAEHQERREGEAGHEARDAPPGAGPEAVERVADLGRRNDIQSLQIMAASTASGFEVKTPQGASTNYFYLRAMQVYGSSFVTFLEAWVT